MKQEHAVSDGLVLEILDSELLGHSSIGPSHQFLLIDQTDSLLPVQFAKLPHHSQSETHFPIHDVHSSNVDQHGFQLILADIHYVVAVLNDMDPAMRFVREFLPVHDPRPQTINNFQQNCTVTQIRHQVVYVCSLDSLGVYPVFEDSDLTALVGLGLSRQLDDFLLG